MHTAEEAKAIIAEEILGRWTDWKPTPMQLADWLRVFTGYSCEEAKNAIGEYAQAYELFNQPKLNLMVKLLDKQAQNRQKNKPVQRTPVVLYSIKCIENSEQPFKVGQKIDFYGPTDKNIDAAKLCKEAEENRISCGNLYGGTWRVINRRQDVPQDEVEREIIPASKNQKRQILKDFIDNNPRYKNLFKKSIFFAEITKDIANPQELVPSAAIDDEPWEFG